MVFISKKLEPVDIVEYRLLRYLRKQRRRAINNEVCVKVTIQNGKLKCKSVDKFVDKEAK